MVDGDMNTIRFRLESIRLHAPETDIVIVGTFLDQAPKPEDHEEIQDTLKANHEQSCAQGSGQVQFFPQNVLRGPELTICGKS